MEATSASADWTERARLVQSWRASGQRLPAWCAQQGLSAASLRYWIKELALRARRSRRLSRAEEAASAGHFVRARVAPEAHRQALVLISPSGWRVVVRRAGVFDAVIGAVLATAMSALPIDAHEVFLAVEPVDIRQGVGRLSAYVQHTLGATPCDGRVYAFRNRAANRIKVLVWDGNGVWLCAPLAQGPLSLAQRSGHALHAQRARLALADLRARLAAGVGPGGRALASVSAPGKHQTGICPSTGVTPTDASV